MTAKPRVCACGRRIEPGHGECDECRKKHLRGSALKVGSPRDAGERVAERAAGHYARGSNALPVPTAAASGRAPGAEPAPESVARELARAGSELAPGPRSEMESHFGRSFSAVRVHADAAAAASARAIGARAYAHGRHVVFGAGEYPPASRRGTALMVHELAHVVQQGHDASAPIRRDLAIEPHNVSGVVRPLAEQDILQAVKFNESHVTNKGTLELIRDVVGLPKEPAVADRELTLAVARFQQAHGVAQDGQIGPTTLLLLVEEVQAEAEAVPALAPKAAPIKSLAPTGTLVDIDASFCGCKQELRDEAKEADDMIAEYTACGADPANTTGGKIEQCIRTRAAATGTTVVTLGSTASTGSLKCGGVRTGPCAPLMTRIDCAHEQIHSVHTRELQQIHGKGTPAFNTAFKEASDWVADEINSRNTDKSLSLWALSVLDRICP